jgi:regulator of sirC expression with transglutaminase-like and TPR domain
MGCSYRSIADYARAITVHGKVTLVYYNRGLAHARLGDNAVAVNDYRCVLALDSTAQSARLRLERLLS